MARKKSVFTPEQGKTVSLSTKVSEELKHRIDQINERLVFLSKDRKLRFNVSSIMAEAIEEAVDDAERELEFLEEREGKKSAGETIRPSPNSEHCRLSNSASHQETESITG